MLLDLPFELRCRIYEFLFSGRRLRWRPQAPPQRLSKAAKPAAILCVSKLLHKESKVIMLKSAQIDVSTMIHHCLQRGQTSPPFDISIVRHILYRCEYALVAPPVLLGITGTVSNLVSLTCAHAPATDYHFQGIFGKVEVTKSDVELIRRLPWPILGGSASDAKPCATARDLIDIWEHCARSFKLVSEMGVYDVLKEKKFAVSVAFSRRCSLLQLMSLQTGHYDLGTKMYKVESPDGTFEKHEFLVDMDF